MTARREMSLDLITGVQIRIGVMGSASIRSRDIVVGGRSGTLGEFAIAYEEGKLIGVLTGAGGITEARSAIEGACGRTPAPR